jgi:hypothetical protein
MRVLKRGMTAIPDLGIQVTLDDVTASWGPRRARLASPRMLELLSRMLAQIDAEGWIQPKLSFRIWPVASSGPGWLDLQGCSRITSRTLGHHMPGATFVAAGVCTIGGVIEKRVSEGFAASDRLRAVMLDEIGTLALFRLADRLEREIQAEAEKLGLEAGGVLNPGEDGLDISLQATIVELADGPSIGISNAALMLVPRKSVSMLLGIGSRMPKWSRGERCAVCAARDRCPHRRSRLVEVSA